MLQLSYDQLCKSSSFDFFLPQGNEEELLTSAQRMGVDQPVFFYSLKDYKNATHTHSDYATGIHLSESATLKDFQLAKQQSSLVLVEWSDRTREFMERSNSFFVYGMEFLSHHDFLHHRNSALHQVFLSLAKQKSITFVFPFSALLQKSADQQQVILGRLAQNLAFCQKKSLSYEIISFCTNPLFVRKDYSSLKQVFLSHKV